MSCQNMSGRWFDCDVSWLSDQYLLWLLIRRKGALDAALAAAGPHIGHYVVCGSLISYVQLITPGNTTLSSSSKRDTSNRLSSSGGSATQEGRGDGGMLEVGQVIKLRWVMMALCHGWKGLFPKASNIDISLSSWHIWSTGSGACLYYGLIVLGDPNDFGADEMVRRRFDDSVDVWGRSS